MGGPKRDERLAVGIREAWQCQCVFLKFDMGTDGFMDRLHEYFGNFNLMCGACGVTVGGQTDCKAPSHKVIWVKSERTYFGSFYEVA